MSIPTHLLDLASSRLDGEVLAANDEFFASKENLLKPGAPVFLPDKYTDRGKWMDGWETRRRRTPGHDWCIVRLGLPGVIRSVVVDTAFFRGNFPSHCSMDACGLPVDADLGAALSEAVRWHPILDRSELAGDALNTFTVADPRRFTHVRLNIFPDGGVARLRVAGEPMPDWTAVLSSNELDLASAANGAHVVDTSDRFFGEPRNMLMPYSAENMGDGWETKRRRGPGHDWAIVRLAAHGTVERIEVATTHFKGNYPESCSVEGSVIDEHGAVSADVAAQAIRDWHEILPRTMLQPDAQHVFAAQLAPGAAATHVRLNIFPDGGISRVRVCGRLTRPAREAGLVRFLNASDEPALRRTLEDFCGAPAWIDRVVRARPYASAAALLRAADAASDAMSVEDVRAAFLHHPRIGERHAAHAQSATAAGWSAREQAGAREASLRDRDALVQANREYEARFGHVFIVCAAGRSTAEILDAIRARMTNDPATELRVAGEEQKRIARLRLERLLA